jgi:cytochrome b561
MVLGLFAHGLWMEDIPDTAAHFQIWLHSAVGITLLLVAAAGWLWWLTNTAPAEPATMPQWQQHAARFAHWALYALIFGVAITGWALTSTLREPVSIDLFGLIGVPQLLAFGPADHELIEEAHEILANALIALVVVHVGAALWHHFVLRDNVLRRMLGGASP